MYDVSSLKHVLRKLRAVFDFWIRYVVILEELWTLLIRLKQAVRVTFVQFDFFGSRIKVYFNGGSPTLFRREQA